MRAISTCGSGRSDSETQLSLTDSSFQDLSVFRGGLLASHQVMRACAMGRDTYYTVPYFLVLTSKDTYVEARFGERRSLAAEDPVVHRNSTSVQLNGQRACKRGGDCDKRLTRSVNVSRDSAE